MQKGKKRLLMAGCALIAIAVLLILYVVLIGFGIINGRQQTLVIRAGTAEKAYDGEPLVCEEWTLVQGELKPGHTLIPSFSGSRTSPGQSSNVVTVYIVDENDVNVTDEYHIECLSGTLSVYHSELHITTTSLSKLYDGMPLSASRTDWTLDSGALMMGHRLSVTMSASLNQVGTCENVARVAITDEGGVDVSRHYSIETTYGSLEILPRPIVVESASATKIYDGSPLTAESAQLSSGTLLPGHKLACQFTGSQTELGNSNNLFTVDVVDGKGDSVASCYDISTVTGRLHVVEVYSAEDAENLSPEANSGINGSGLPNSDTNVLAIQTDVAGPAYLRLQSFGSYNVENFGWDVSPALTELVCEFNPMYWIGSALLQSGESLSTMDVTWMVTPRGLLVPYYTQSDFDIGVDDSYIALGMANYTVDYVSYDAMQTLIGKLSSLTLPEECLADEADYRAFVQEHFLAIPTQELQDAMARHIAAAGIDPMSKTLIQDVAGYIQNAAVYNLDAPVAPDGVDPIIFFLDESKEGVCRHYASSAVMMYRSLGVPARYVVGYLANAEPNTLTMVTGMQAHAWVEVYIDGLGWLPVEVTGGSSLPNGGVGSGAEEKIQISVKPKPVNVIADGTEHRATDFRMSGKLKENHQLSCTFGGSQAEPGTAVSYITSFSIQDTVTGEDVSDLYDVQLSEGIIRVVDKSEDLEDMEESRWLTVKPVDVKGPYTGLPLAATDWELVEGSDSLKDGHDLICEFAGEQTDVGESPSSIVSHTVIDLSTGEDVTDQYEVTYHSGTIRVESQKVDLIIKPVDVVGYADGTTWMATECELVSGSDALLPGHTPRYKIIGSLAVIGKTNTVISEYSVMDESGQDVTNMYNIVLKNGWIEVKGRISIKPVDVTVTYDGQEHSATDWTYVEENATEVLPGHKMVCEYAGSLTYPIFPQGIFTDEQAYLDACKQETEITRVLIVDRKTGKDVTNLYEITRYPGYIYMPGVEISIKPTDVQEMFTGEEFAPTEWEYKWGSKELLEGHVLECTYEGSLKFPIRPEGTFESDKEYFEACCLPTSIVKDSIRITDTATGADMTGMYKVNLESGSITIMELEFLVEPKDSQFRYNGQEHVATAYTTTAITNLDGSGDWLKKYSVIVQLDGRRVDYGSTPITVASIRVEDRNGEDVTEGFAIECTQGTLTVYAEKLAFKTGGISRPYNGTALTNDSWKLISGTTLDGHTLSVDMSASVTTVGSVKNHPVVTVLDENGEDVTYWYYLDHDNSEIGTLSVTKAKVTIRSCDATAVYVPGQTLICHDYEITSGEIAAGETVEVLITGEQMSPGKSENFMEWEDIRVYRDGVETTSNYKITAVTGTLTVIPPQ